MKVEEKVNPMTKQQQIPQQQMIITTGHVTTTNDATTTGVTNVTTNGSPNTYKPTNATTTNAKYIVSQQPQMNTVALNYNIYNNLIYLVEIYL